MGKRSRPFVVIFLVIIVTSSIVYFHTNSNNFIYAQVELQDSPAGLKITSPATGQKVQVGQLEVKGTSTDDATTDCQVYVDLNDIKPMQKTTAVGSGGVNDYSNWAFKYTNNYHLIPEGVNELTARMTCIDNAEKVTKYYSVNVTGVDTSYAANYRESTTDGQTKVSTSTDTVDQTPSQTAQGVQKEPKQVPQSESKPQTDLVSKA
jgi:hypothetical protein